MINFDYSLDEIVQMDGKGPVSLRTALIHMPDRVGRWASYIGTSARSRCSSMLYKFRR